MRVRLHLSIESDAGHIEEIKEVLTLERPTKLTPERVGLSLAESKQVLHELQQIVVAHQTAAHVADQQQCPDCGAERKRKGTHTLVYRTLFGKLKIASPRFYACPCRPRTTRSSSPLADVLQERTAPELVYLESKFAALMSYGLTVEVLAEVLPFTHERSVATVHRNLQRLAERAEQELGEEKDSFLEYCQRDLDALPPPAAPITVGLDGGYVHAKEQRSRTEGWFEVIVGKSLPQEEAGKCLAFVQKYDQKPKRRLYEVLQAQGVQANQSVIFLSDGADTVRNLPEFLIPESEHWLDWFHITLRLTGIGQMIKGLVDVPERTDHATPLSPDDELPSQRVSIEELEKTRESMKWNVWNGKVRRALERTEELRDALETWPSNADKVVKLKKAVNEFASYIALNQASIPNYGDRQRHGERIASSFVESAVNQVVSRRMVKKQHMRWSERGAHLLLQVRTQVLNGDLRQWFSRWYPAMEEGSEPVLLDAAA
jgi:hypothetical protein